ncbi:GT2 family glycosyltransferase [Herbihabitans rhizosphaerae]|uniref:GT2 family glycosyltransferase n=1 Tax=Herbihabitans rhizosphaerae TaxID=1872711 RepID=A0A4Q7KQA8_9PSEU|nr:glycosyltransferase [Herbihabitans rhizosphaerae]RZS37492.1 GT2 family glycosyltransferase [Herbihabitans rhizosphaerae]
MTMPGVGDRRVTVVIVSYGGGELVAHCLELLAKHTNVGYRVIVVDSASPDGTGQWLADNLTDTHLAGGEVLRLNENLGFGAGCNLGVRHADTEFVCFLNADVEVTDGWLDPLVEFLDTHEYAAAVAPVMLNADGTVQEAGSVIGGDGWCRAHDAEVSLFPREVDYASAACLLVRRNAFHAAGGFSPEYEIAYFEDVDLAMSMRERGLTTWLQPASRVTHARHGSSSSARATELMRLNHGTFRRRWPDELARRAPVVGLDEHPHRHWWLRDHLAPYRVLLIDDRVPQADRGRGDPRTMAVVDAWRAADPRARVTFFAASPERAEEYAPALRAKGIEVVSGVEDAAAWSTGRAGLYDVIVAFRPHNFIGLGERIAAAQPQAVRVYDSEALFHRRPEQHFTRTDDHDRRRHFAVEADRLRQQEVRAFTWADVAVCVSEEEARWARSVAPSTQVHVACYPAAVPDDVPDDVPGWDGRHGIVFFGGFDDTPGTPNEFAVLELAGHVLPGLRERHPELDLRVVGADPSPAVKALAGQHIQVLGKVPNPRPVLSSALLHVVPMHYGAGVKIKFVDSMAAGLPFVTTAVGAEGLHLGRLARHLVGNSPAEIVERCDTLLRDRPLWTDVQGELLAICREHFSVAAFDKQMTGVLADCGIAP